MPEGDSVYRATAMLHATLAGQQLASADFRVPQLATTDLSGYTVHAVVPYGKHLLMRMLPPEPAAPGQLPVTLHSHLLMEGRWDLYSPGERFKRPIHTARVILRTATVLAVGFNIAQVKLVPTAGEEQLTGHLGPDLLGPGWDRELALANLRRDPARGIGEALLDQQLLAGIGNIYRAEVLFLTRVHPLAAVGTVHTLGAVVDMAQKLLEVNKNRARRVTTGLARTRDPYWVYGRAGKPCLRCGTRIESMAIASTTAYGERDCCYCPSCQAPG